MDEERGNVEEMLEEISESIKYGMSDVSSDECSFEQEEVVNIATTQQEDKQVTETIPLVFNIDYLHPSPFSILILKKK